MIIINPDFLRGKQHLEISFSPDINIRSELSASNEILIRHYIFEILQWCYLYLLVKFTCYCSIYYYI